MVGLVLLRIGFVGGSGGLRVLGVWKRGLGGRVEESLLRGVERLEGSGDEENATA